MDNFDVIFYDDETGEKPVYSFLLSLDTKMRAKITALMKVLSEKGNTLREPYSKHLEDGIFELRCKQGSNIVRVLYFFDYGHKIVVTNGFVKKSNRTPRSQIEISKQYRKAYLKGCKDESK